ncbi:MAG: YkgJ family cysteine cluster protein [Candidatus Nanoarchaeia archaeon]|nr:YkgJ family cysteine cluster protein [Candidatus Nanoarchaeia archaeon]
MSILKNFQCKQCGRCCMAQDHIDICEDDIKKWKNTKGYKWLCNSRMIIEWDYFGTSRLFRNLNTDKCPFLKKYRNKNKYYCKINSMKPKVCLDFPIDKKQYENFKQNGCMGALKTK